jgi:hypothetical protein
MKGASKEVAGLGAGRRRGLCCCRLIDAVLVLQEVLVQTL